MERMKNEDQVAAVIADGIAANLQSRQARIARDMNLISAAELALYVGVRSGAGLGAGAVGGAIITHEILRKMEQQRGRVALGLMADAGFDPWQAPEAWRLLDPKQLPKDFTKLKYPERSGYQLEMLSLQYRKSAEAQVSPAD
jgi:predicted Zn-dependent protease